MPAARFQARSAAPTIALFCRAPQEGLPMNVPTSIPPPSYKREVMERLAAGRRVLTTRFRPVSRTAPIRIHQGRSQTIKEA